VKCNLKHDRLPSTATLVRRFSDEAMAALPISALAPPEDVFAGLE